MALGTFLFISLLVFVVSAKECEDKVEYHLGTKSPYRFVSNRTYAKDINLQGCLKKIWLLSRHGTRNPSVDQIRKIIGHLPILRHIILQENSNIATSNLVKSDIELFAKWKPRIEEKDEKKLTVEGEHEMIELAERLQVRYPDILPSIYSNTSYKFQYTRSQRARKSAQSFAIGLFGKKTANSVYYPEPIKHDPILRFYKLCSKWKSDVKKNDTTYRERKAFQESLTVEAALEKINKKLGLKNKLSFDDAFLMYTVCAFETAWTSRRKSPWCVPFDVDTVKVFEYAEDLKYYWVDGYAYEITYKQACVLFNNMLNFLLDVNEYPKATLYFTHSGTLLKMLSHLGLYNDKKPLKETDFATNANRKWRVSKIDSFGSNLAFILYSCNNEDKLLVLHNESPVRLPACPDSDLCDLKLVQQYYSTSINECSFDSTCENEI